MSVFELNFSDEVTDPVVVIIDSEASIIEFKIAINNLEVASCNHK